MCFTNSNTTTQHTKSYTVNTATSSRDGGSVSVNIDIFWGIGIGWTKIHSISIGIGKYQYFLGIFF